MASSLSGRVEDDEIVYQVSPLLTIYKSGRVDRPLDAVIVPADAADLADLADTAGVSFKDLVISSDTGHVSARLYLPKRVATQARKVPLLFYFHGGGFCIGNPFMRCFHDYVVSLVEQANVVAVSVDYRLAPEHPIPAAYEDAWTALRWATAGATADLWLADHADFDRVFLAGESAGANIAHHTAMRAAKEALHPGSVGLRGIVLVHPYLLGSNPLPSEEINPGMTAGLKRMWEIAYPAGAGDVDHPWINPLAEGAPSLTGLGSRRVLVCLAEEDVMRDRGREYFQRLREGGWEGESELYESPAKGHAFHLLEADSQQRLALDQAICNFLII
ncbi:probable carboxylesterase 12 [Zingiber officinale]|uniref:probable carboxylesterase 12 n=1 Tax=Zingiber officinale TaxID=94328 RepID=UPI001C4AFD70|nr:probable carboxylesterase 12 [Zingiber officinale]